MSANADFPVRQEADVVAGRKLATIGAAALVVGVVGVFFAAAIVIETSGSLRPNAAGPLGVRPAPAAIARVAQTPIWTTEEGIDDNRRQRAKLETLGWANRAGGMARIPIEDAMDLVVEESR